MDQPTLQAAHELHLQALRRLRRRPTTLQAYRVYVGALLRFLDERDQPATLAALNVPTVEAFQDWLRARSYGSRDGAAAERQAIRIVKSFVALHHECSSGSRSRRPRIPMLSS